MTKHAILLICTTLALCCVGCKEDTTQSKSVSQPYQEFTSLVCNCPIRITLSAKATEIVVTAERHLIDDILVTYDDDELSISIANMNQHYWEETPWVILPMPQRLQKVKFYSMIEFDADATIVTDELQLDFSSAVQLKANIEAQKMTLKSLAYGTTCELTGVVPDVELELHSAIYNANDLKVDTYRCVLWNTTANLCCEKNLYIDTANGSIVNYRGACEVATTEDNIWNSTIQKNEE